METKVYKQDGKEAGEITLPKGIFDLSWNANLVHDVVTSMMTNKRINFAHTKGRGDVRGGGKKPWRQKGTGRARHGSTRSPIWVGGGVAHGPTKDKNYHRKVNKKVKAKTLRVILSQKLKDTEILFLESLILKEPKTSKAKDILKAVSGIKGFENLSKKKNNSAMITLDRKDLSVEKGFRNMGNVKVEEIKNLNPLDLLQYKYLIITSPKTALEKIPGKS